MQSKRIIDWAQYQQLFENMVAGIGLDEPDCIVGLTRGGLVPAVQLSHLYDVPMYVVNVSLRDGKVAKDTFEWSVLDKYSSIVVVDDINDSGATLNYILDKCYLKLINHPRFATLLSKPSSSFTPSLIGEVINKEKEDEWIVFPWEQE